MLRNADLYSGTVLVADYFLAAYNGRGGDTILLNAYFLELLCIGEAFFFFVDGYSCASEKRFFSLLMAVFLRR